MKLWETLKKAVKRTVRTMTRAEPNTCSCCGRTFGSLKAYVGHKCPKNGWLTPADPAFASRRRR